MFRRSSLTGIFAAVRSLFSKGGDCMYILVMGRTGTGKSSFVNTATGSHLPVGSTLSSQTQSIQLSRPVQIDSKRVILIDTPGLDDTSKSTEEVIRMVSTYLARLRKRGITPQGTIYLHRISDNRMGQVALQSLVAFREMCAQEALTDIVIVLNMWEDVSHDMRETRRRALCGRETYFKPLLDAGAVTFHHDRTASSAHAVIQHLTRRAPQTASIGRTNACRHAAKTRTSAQTAPIFKVSLYAASYADEDEPRQRLLEYAKAADPGYIEWPKL
ncbi:P-loop containing nucleoside triphosphate hydrolase protein [Daedalea quercina L-15889]|uniref:p-loop containing nucleoside triphosphate hydrolase protein n=1 Tax=Daedalea quercina L-15889 TaxID=1314783 RepID=A0A165U0B2_9APHY|nr:P-loop containing nucleoside triphosphate hydrolase protein [Daedalea quercina L-15889]